MYIFAYSAFLGPLPGLKGGYGKGKGREGTVEEVEEEGERGVGKRQGEGKEGMRGKGENGNG